MSKEMIDVMIDYKILELKYLTDELLLYINEIKDYDVNETLDKLKSNDVIYYACHNYLPEDILYELDDDDVIDYVYYNCDTDDILDRIDKSDIVSHIKDNYDVSDVVEFV